MDDSKIFIVGANGQLGKALQEKYPGARTADKDELDITNKSSVEKFKWSGVEIIINAAAYTNVDLAETPEGRLDAWSVNAVAVANISAIAARHGMTLVHISSEYVFDGTQEIHTEDERFSPLSVYGSAKAAGDIAASLTPKFYILRITGLMGEGKNFVRTMIELAKKGVNPSVVSDQIGRITFTSELVRAIDHLLLNVCTYGTYNLSNDGKPTSWSNIARKVYEIAGFENSVTDISTEEYFKGKVGIAPRPLQSTLDLSKIQSTGFKSTDWQEELKKYIL